MKRIWFGAALLLILLGLGIGSSMLMGAFHEPLAELLKDSAEYALAENWDNAVKTSENARITWEKMWHFSATLSDHGPMEEVDALFGQLEIYEKCRDPVNFAAVCASLARQIEAIGDAHELNWWNLL